MKKGGAHSAVVVIDGPAGAGKSTVSQKLADQLNFLYLDSGALYRAIALAAHNQKIEPKNSKKLYSFCKSCRISFKKIKGNQRVFLNDKDVTRKIRTQEISLLASRYSRLPGVRKALLYQQRKLGEKGGLVGEGRDLGTIVFPKADVKFFLTASLKERAKRRYLELEAEGSDLKKLKEEIKRRDQQDAERKLSPLKKAADAIVIDTTSLTIDQVVSTLYKKCKEIL